LASASLAKFTVIGIGVPALGAKLR